MLTLARSPQFGRQLGHQFGQSDSVDPATLDMGSVLAQAESQLKNAFNALQMLVVSAPDASINSDTINRYTQARDAFVQAVDRWKRAREQTPPEDLPDPDAVPTYPPDMSTLGAAGFGAVLPAGAPIQLRNIVVKYGPVGQEKVSGLGGTIGDPFFAGYYSSPGQQGLGIGVTLLILLTVAIVGVTVILVSKFITDEKSTVQVARSDADRALALAQQVNAEMTTLSSTAISCMGTSNDPAVRQQCITTAQTAAAKTLAATPTSPKTAVIGVLKYVGIALLVIGGGAGAYYLLKSKKHRGEPEHAGEHEPEHPFEHEPEY